MVKISVNTSLAKTGGQVTKGSVGDVARANNLSIAQVFSRGVKYVIIMDVSSSMHTGDSRDYRSRYDVAVEELKGLQSTLSGSIAIFSFCDNTAFEPGGIPEMRGGGTDMAGALRYTLPLNAVPAVEKFIVISDGEPDSQEATLAVAATYSKPIFTIFAGNEGNGRAVEFMEKLSARTRGKSLTKDSFVELGKDVERFLLEGGS